MGEINMKTDCVNRSIIAASLTLGLGSSQVLAISDCNSNAITDADEISSGRSFDVNGNGVPDSCEGLSTGPVLRSIAINMGPTTCGWWTTTPRGAWFAWVSRETGVGPWVNGSSASGNTQKLDMQLVSGVQTIHVRCNSNGCGSNFWGLGLWFEEVAAPQLAVSPGTPSLSYDGPIPAPYLPGSPLQTGNGATSAEVGPWTVTVLSYSVANTGDLVGPISLGGGNGIDHLTTLVLEVRRTTPCDVTGNGTTDAVDLAALLAAWGSNGQGEFNTDIDGSGLVDGGDLALVLGGWGPCPQ
jgi:hypothetical protein